jgi:Domain of Unknown Function (DUF1080)
MRFVACLFLISASVFAAEPPTGFKPIFNGKDLSGWHGWAIHESSKGADGKRVETGSPAALAKMTPDERSQKIAAWTDDAKKHWSVKDGELINDGFGAYLATEKEYGDYELLIDYKTVPKADSGIYLKNTPQVQIWDSTEADPQGLGKKLGSGGLWNNSKGAAGKDPLVLADKPFGEWNTFRIRQLGEMTTIYLNDKLIVDHARLENYFDRKSPLPKVGKFLLQTHGGEIRWRNIFIREIPAAEANAVLAKKAVGDGFKPLFDGTSLDGWAGATENYEVKDGAIVCKPKKGGVLHTKAEYENFVATLEFKLPPNGNNGLAIRYPGQGDTAYTGMCELQVLADDYKGIDPRQAHGSAYGMAAAKRGYQRPIGEWNFQQVTVKGSTIKVELNGNLILDTDLASVTEYMAKKDHPGKARTKGYFGFAGHSDPVAFRNVMMKELK